MIDHRIRPMEDNDWAAVCRIYQQGIDSGVSTFQTQVPSQADWNAGHLYPCRLILEQTASSGVPEIVGFCGLTSVRGGCHYRGLAEISLYLDAAVHGKGLGKQFLEALIEDSQQEGFWTLHAEIMEPNVASLALFQKCGFRTIGYREAVAKDVHGTWQNTILMERRCKPIK